MPRIGQFHREVKARPEERDPRFKIPNSGPEIFAYRAETVGRNQIDFPDRSTSGIIRTLRHPVHGEFLEASPCLISILLVVQLLIPRKCLALEFGILILGLNL